MFESVVLAFALHTSPAMINVPTPMVKASVIPAAWSRFAECVSNRESNHSYRSENKSSSAQGRWQFLDRAWRINGGIEWIVLKQLRKHGVPWAKQKKVYAQLTVTPIKRWPAWAQDAAFVGVVTSKEGMGWKHWYLAGSPCNTLVPASA